MQQWSAPSATPSQLRPCVATFGNFDGVHRGHRAILDELVRQGRERDLPVVAVTFDPHPVEVMHPERAPELIAPGRLRNDYLEQAGVDGLLVLPFTWEFAQTSATDYIVDTFVTGLGASALVVGADTKGFGAGYTGDVSLIRALGEEHGFDVVVIDDQGEGERWSSSAVRTHLAAGEVEEAAQILGRAHRVVGTVVHGHHRGRDLGYPTANLDVDTLGLVPSDGVYAGWLTRLDLAEGSEDRHLPTAISVGTNPTFDGQVRVVEAYVLDRTALDLYGERVAVDFVGHVRPTLRFDSVDELLEAMAADVERTRVILDLPTPESA